MTAILGPVVAWWDGRTRREQIMVGGLGVVLLLFVLWLAVLRPAWAWRAEAAEDRAIAARNLGEVRLALARLQPSAPVGSAPTSASIEPVIQQSATATGLTLTTAMDASGALGFRITSASSATLFGWLSTLAASGVEIERLSIAENADATLNADGALAPVGAR